MQRFEGANLFAGAVTQPSPSVRGKIAFSRITVLDGAGNVAPRHLNKHIDYSSCCTLKLTEVTVRVPHSVQIPLWFQKRRAWLITVPNPRLWRSSGDSFVQAANQIAAARLLGIVWTDEPTGILTSNAVEIVSSGQG